MFLLYKNNSEIIYDILHNSHVISIFSNSIAVFNTLQYLICNTETTFGNLRNISNVTIDIPSYFHNYYGDDDLFASNAIFNKLFYPHIYSSIIKNNILVIVCFVSQSLILIIHIFLLIRYILIYGKDDLFQTAFGNIDISDEK